MDQAPTGIGTPIEDFFIGEVTGLRYIAEPGSYLDQVFQFATETLKYSNIEGLEDSSHPDPLAKNMGDGLYTVTETAHIMSGSFEFQSAEEFTNACLAEIIRTARKGLETLYYDGYQVSPHSGKGLYLKQSATSTMWTHVRDNTLPKRLVPRAHPTHKRTDLLGPVAGCPALATSYFRALVLRVAETVFESDSEKSD